MRNIMKVWSLGDAVVDLLPMKNMQYQACAGGAPANVAVGIAQLGGEVGFLGRVGDDPFGHFLKRSFSELGVDCHRMEFDEKYKTSTVVVDLAPNGERSFSFLVSPSADQFLTPQSLPEFKHDILHFCSLGLVGELCRATIELAVEQVKQAGLVSFDVNLRAQMWADKREMRDVITEYSRSADILKLSDDELFWLTETIQGEWQQALSKLADYRAELIVITCGAAGCLVIWNKERHSFGAYLVDSVDTTGAGDAFVAGLLQGIVERGVPTSHQSLRELISQASACGALATTNKGALAALPDRGQLDAFIANHKLLPIRADAPFFL
jgi:fructokinase